MVKKSKVVCTTVGPYAKYGTNLVEACIEGETNYCDITGETQWIRRIIDRFHTKAKEKNIKIINSCGFDSIPSDNKNSQPPNKTTENIITTSFFIL
jgi:short subunit dehydrogenase-like uncharacterized protein